ncbi:MAG TPA: ATP-binding cassette domain-containing protein [Deltaproteobacteria bacterium]|nr:ATP-binding cassette domain-containing protein [Deltaproteobacteria bacterium]HPJ93959.1 ATP-binding cassette domain-containing protein [Deltaproteobacteria bacterium]HPR51346.1 ATP-binding cassette domain-containing protein [Deltaproteobacteria bacterium]
MTYHPILRFEDVGFSYDSMTSELLSGVNVRFLEGWTGIVGPNGIGKTTLLLLACGKLRPDSGFIDMPELSSYCPQRTDDPPEGAALLMDASDRDSLILKADLDLEQEDLLRWETLSHGERKRFQIAAALYRQPDLLALDEPTNHLDSATRSLLFRALKKYKGIGLLVSHDRELLDNLCRECVFIDPPTAILRPGNYSSGAYQARLEKASAINRLNAARARLDKLEREHARRKHKASRSVRLNPKRHLLAKDHDAKAKVDAARMTGKDSVHGKLQKQMEGRLQKVREEISRIPVKKEYPTGITMLGSICPRASLLNLPAGNLPLGEKARLMYPDLNMLPQDRIALTGPNGCGKTTIITTIFSSLSMPDDRVIYVPQELDINESSRLLRELHAMSGEKLGWVMNIISRLGSRPETLLESKLISPGETRKVMLALGLLKEPWLIMMDEPTNHLDLISIECLEGALADCRCSLLLISHDMRFLEALTQIQWEILQVSNDNYSLYITSKGSSI